MIRDQEVLNQLVDTIHRFVRDRLIPAEQSVAENDAIPEDIAREMKEMGLFGLSIPEEYGGLGLTMEEEALVAFEIAIPRRRSALSSVPITASAPRAF